MDVGNLVSGSSAFSKSSLHIWNFLVHILLKDFEHYLTGMWNECSCEVFENIPLPLPFFGIGMKTDLFQSVATAEFSKFAGILSAAL